MKHLIAVSAAFVLSANVAAAQSTAGTCGAPSETLLSSLTGTWSLAQGPGAAFAVAPGLGATALPLPAQPAQPVNLTFADPLPFGMISAQGQSMVMLPAGSEPTGAQIAWISEEDGLQTLDIDAQDCGWPAMPSFVATTSYMLQDFGPTSPSLNDLIALPAVGFGDVPAILIGVCQDTPTLEALEEVMNIEDPNAMFGILDHTPGDGPVNILTTVVTNEELCERYESNVPPGDMQMLLFLQFNSPNSASGVLSFKGKMSGNRFSARAPVTLAR